MARGDSGHHRALTPDAERYRRTHERIDALERRFESLEEANREVLEVFRNTMVGVRAAAWVGKVIKWFAIVGAAGIAIITWYKTGK